MSAVTTLRPMTRDDWPAVAEIFQQGIDSGDATFETELPTWEAWDRGHRPDCRLVAEDGVVVGWAALAPFSPRSVYRGVAEISVYVAEAERGHGVGTLLMEGLVAAAQEAGIWSLHSGIFPENLASLSLHKRHGFREVGVLERLGQFHDGRWRDVVILERRES